VTRFTVVTLRDGRDRIRLQLEAAAGYIDIELWPADAAQLGDSLKQAAAELGHVPELEKKGGIP